MDTLNVSAIYTDLFAYEATLKQAEAEYHTFTKKPLQPGYPTQRVKFLKEVIRECKEEIIAIQKILHSIS
jgi:hypothetical protein